MPHSLIHSVTSAVQAEWFPRWRNLVLNRNCGAFAEAFVFQTTFRHRGGYSATTMRTSILHFYSSWRQRKLFPVAPNADGWVFFRKEIGSILLILGANVCIIYWFDYWSAIKIVDYLFLSTKCSDRWRSAWNSNASPKFDFLHANTKYTCQGQHRIYM